MANENPKPFNIVGCILYVGILVIPLAFVGKVIKTENARIVAQAQQKADAEALARQQQLRRQQQALDQQQAQRQQQQAQEQQQAFDQQQGANTYAEVQRLDQLRNDLYDQREQLYQEVKYLERTGAPESMIAEKRAEYDRINHEFWDTSQREHDLAASGSR